MVFLTFYRPSILTHYYNFRPAAVLDKRTSRLLKFDGEVDREFNLTVVLLLVGIILLYVMRQSLVGTSGLREALIRARAMRPKVGSGAHKRAV